MILILDRFHIIFSTVLYLTMKETPSWVSRITKIAKHWKKTTFFIINLLRGSTLLGKKKKHSTQLLKSTKECFLFRRVLLKSLSHSRNFPRCFLSFSTYFTFWDFSVLISISFFHSFPGALEIFCLETVTF